MAPSTDSNSADPMSSSFSSARLVQSFPRRDTVKLEERSFVQWQQHIRLIIEGYELQGFLEGTLAAPSQFVASSESTLLPNPDASLC